MTEEEKKEYLAIRKNRMEDKIREADCCQNCKYCHDIWPFDDPIGYYCTFYAAKPPELDLKMPMFDPLSKTTEEISIEYDTIHQPKLDEYFEKEEIGEIWKARYRVWAGSVCDNFVKLVKKD